MYYALHIGGGGGVGRGRGDARGLMRVLTTLPNCQAQRAFEDPFLHTLVILIDIAIDNIGNDYIEYHNICDNLYKTIIKY
jgi:hypothetical protein